MSENESERKRKPYTPPEVEQIELMPEETLGSGCKMAASGPTPSGNCFIQTCVVEIGS